MKRWHDPKEQAKMKRQCAIWNRYVPRFPTKELGRFRKRHAMDCGNPKCTICGKGKKRIPTRQELKNELPKDGT